jgi:hypothetical protein
MAHQGEKAGLRGTAERGIRFLRDVHIGIGGVALLGALLIPPLEAVAASLAIYEGVNALAHEGLRRIVAGRKKN